MSPPDGEWCDLERNLRDLTYEPPNTALRRYPSCLMIVQSLLSATVPTLAVGDAMGQALYRMAEHSVAQLPVVSADGRFLGLVGEAALRQEGNPDAPIATLETLSPITAAPDLHVFDAAHLMLRHGLSVLPVIADGVYLGVVVRAALFRQLAHMLATEEPGSILVLEGERRDFSLAQLAYLIEQNDIRILSVSTEDEPEADLVRVTLKLNVTDTARVRHLLEHHGYRLAALFDEAEADLQERVDAFMRYLEV